MMDVGAASLQVVVFPLMMMISIPLTNQSTLSSPVDLLILMNQVGSKLTGLILNYLMPSPPEIWAVTPLLGCIYAQEDGKPI